MGKATKRQQETQEAAEQALLQRFTAHNKEERKTVITPTAFNIMPACIQKYSTKIIRDPANWIYRGKSKKIEKQRSELIRYMFAEYRVPKFLERAFIAGQFCEWYLAVAQGKSLYKTCTREILTKKETHYFLQAPDDLSVTQAIWWARSLAVSNNIGIARRVALSALPRRAPHDSNFWIDVQQFFSNNPIPIAELNELLDFVEAAKQENPNWSIKKRSLQSIRRLSEKWHRDIAKIKSLGGGSWAGMGIPPWRGKSGKFHKDPQKNTRTTWSIYEITTGRGLAEEGNRMRHCVWGYKSRCMSGDVAIFTMCSETALKPNQRRVTIEVIVRSREIVQVRGLANRPARPQEKAVLKKWAHCNNLKY